MHFKSFLFAIAIIAAMLISCNADDTKSEEASYEQTRKILLEKELKNPANFLSVTGQDKKNLLGQTVIKGKLSNRATIAVYKDVEVKLSFYSKTRALLETETETIFEQVQPGQTKNFKTKYFAPKGTDSVAIQILNAKMGTY